MPCGKKHIFILYNYDYYKSVCVLYIALHFILIECSEAKLYLFKKIRYIHGGNIEKITSEIKILFAKDIFRILT